KITRNGTQIQRVLDGALHSPLAQEGPFPAVNISPMQWSAFSDHRPMLITLHREALYEITPSPVARSIDWNIFRRLTNDLPDDPVAFSRKIADAAIKATFFKPLTELSHWFNEDCRAARKRLKKAR